MKKIVSIAAAGLLILSACTRDKTIDPNAIPQDLDFSTYRMFNDVGDAVGISGDGIDDDYQMEEWAPWVHKLFAPLDTASLAGTERGIIDHVVFFPTPCMDVQRVSLRANTTTVFKFVIINEQGEVMRRYSGRQVKDAANAFIYDLKPFVKGYYRIYYSFSAEGNTHFFRAHADIEKK